MLDNPATGARAILGTYTGNGSGANRTIDPGIGQLAFACVYETGGAAWLQMVGQAPKNFGYWNSVYTGNMATIGLHATAGFVIGNAGNQWNTNATVYSYIAISYQS
jgi:hypothetical protein